MERDLPESRMADPVTRWMRSLFLEVIPEVTVVWSPVDLVGMSADWSVMHAVEMKTTWNKSLFRKFSWLASVADYLWFATKGSPLTPTLDALQQRGIGVFSVQQGVILTPRRSTRIAQRYRARAIDKAKRASRDVVAGLPTLKGQGPAQRCWKAIEEFLTVNPSASVRDIFEAVPNHYAHYKSFSQVFSFRIRQTRAAMEGR